MICGAADDALQVSVADPAMLPLVAVIVAVPGPAQEATPVAETDANVVFEVHTTAG